MFSLHRNIQFNRSIVLPESVNLDKKIEAHYENGILNIALTKKEEYKVIPKTKVIEIT